MLNRRDLLLLALATPLVEGCNMTETPIPMQVTIGQSIFALAALHPELFRLEALADDSSALLVRPVKLTLNGAGPALSLPPTLFASLNQAAGIVTGLITSPTLSRLPLASAHALALSLMAMAEGAGWTAIARSPVIDLAAFGAAADRVDGKYGAAYAEYKLGSAELFIDLKRPASVVAGDPDAWLIDIMVSDRAIDDRANALVYERRKQVTGGTNSLPLSVWRPR